MRLFRYYLLIFVISESNCLSLSRLFEYRQDPLTINSSSECVFRISNDSTEFKHAISETIDWEDGMAQHINIQIILNGNDTEVHSKNIILTNLWLLTYIDPNGPFYYVSWRSDFRILSMNLLNDYTNKPIGVNINETSGQ